MNQDQYKAKNGYNPLDALHKELERQYDDAEGLDPNREKPKNTFKKEIAERVIQKLKEGKPCWKGYEQIGMKEKDGKQVPNCVPNKK